MNEKTFKLLEFDTIREGVADLALSEEASALILAEMPLFDREKTQKLKSLVSSLMERMVYLGGEKRESLPDIGRLLSSLDVEGAMLEIDEVYAIGVFIKRADTFRQWLLKPMPRFGGVTVNPMYVPDKNINSEAGDSLSKTAGELPDCTGVSADIFRILDNEGNLRDLPEFRDIKRRIKSLQKEIESTGSRYAKSDDTRRMLQSEIPSQRDGRMVLAVKAHFRGRIRGIVHEVSATGQTIFVEPEEVVEKNNELLIENRRLEAEIRRVLREFTVRITLQRDILNSFHEGMLFLETIRARARYGFERQGSFAREETSKSAGSPEEKLMLKKARHPLLGKRAVPLELSMESGIRTVIITGPNTGGKTVALKTLGLLAMMNQFGLALPVEEGTFLPVFDGVYADIGDEQSISQSLSTFSAHMTNIADIINCATDRSLVLLDELGSGTDPEEGSAIAMAILDYFIEHKARLIVTTHHGILKNYGYTREGVENASMEFDSRTLSPTFKIVMGVPGESRAVDIAARNGFPPELVERARSYLDEERSDVSALITGLKEKHRELDAAAEAGKKEEKRLLEERRQADLKELRLKQKELQLRSDGVGSLRKLLGESRKTLENLVREVKEGELNREKTLKVKEFLSGLEAQVQGEDAALEKEVHDLASELRSAESRILEEGITGSEKRGKGRPASEKTKNRQLETGVEVLAGESRSRGRILRLDKKSQGETFWVVEIGSLKMTFSEKDLHPVIAETGENTHRKNASWTADLAPSAHPHSELKLRGMRLADAIESLERQMDAAVLGGLHVFSVVHGKGDGILSKGVHDFLKRDSRVADYYFSHPEMGGFGRTEVILK